MSLNYDDFEFDDDIINDSPPPPINNLQSDSSSIFDDTNLPPTPVNKYKLKELYKGKLLTQSPDRSSLSSNDFLMNNGITSPMSFSTESRLARLNDGKSMEYNKPIVIYGNQTEVREQLKKLGYSDLDAERFIKDYNVKMGGGSKRRRFRKSKKAKRRKNRRTIKRRR